MVDWFFLAQRALNKLEPLLFFAPKLPACALLSIVGQLEKRTGERAACVKRMWRGSVETAKRLGMYVALCGGRRVNDGSLHGKG